MPRRWTWRGSGRLFLAGQAFRRWAPLAEGMKLQAEGLADLDRGVALERDTIGTRAARAPVLMSYAPFVRPTRPCLRRPADRDGDRSTSSGSSRATSPRWSGSRQPTIAASCWAALAAGWLQLDKAPKAAPYLERMIARTAQHALREGSRRAARRSVGKDAADLLGLPLSLNRESIS